MPANIDNTKITGLMPPGSKWRSGRRFAQLRDVDVLPDFYKDSLGFVMHLVHRG